MADISKIDNGTEYNLKDATARAGIESSKTLKSSVVTVTDAAPINAEDITVDITPQQDLHGYDRPWAGGAGKNKLPMTVEGIKAANNNWGSSWSGNALVVRDITVDLLTDSGNNLIGIKFNGTSSGQFSFNFIGNTTPYVANTYGGMKINGFDGQTSPSQYCTLIMYSNDGTNWANEAYQAGGNDTTILSNYNYVAIGFLIRSGQTLNNVVVRPMIRLSTETDATFAPYSNECPLKGRTGAKLDRVGKNWFDRSKFCVNAFLQGGIRYAQGTGTCLVFDTEDLIGQTITISSSFDNRYVLVGFDVDASTLISSDYIYSGTQISTTSWTERTFSVEYKAYVYYVSNNGFKESLGNGVQLELGSTATTYEPYQGQQYTADFGETVHGGKWHVTAGGTDNEMGEVDLGDLTWTYQSVYQRFYAPLVSAKAVPNDQVANALCTQYKLIEVDGTVTSNDGVIGISANRNVIVRDTRYNDVTQFTTAVTGQKLVYEKATPTAISTPKQNVPMLQGINTVSADCGDTQLKYQPDNVIGELKGEIEDNIIYEDFKWTTNSSQSYSAGTPGTYGTSSWRDVKKEGYDVIGVTFVENRRFGDCILTLNYIPSTDHVEVIIFRATSSAVTIADEDIAYRVAYKKRP